MHLGYGEGCSVYAGYEHNRLLLQDFPLSLRGAKPFDSSWSHAPLAFGQSGGRVKVGDWQVFPETAWSAIRRQVQQRVKQQAREAHRLGFNEPLDATVTFQDMIKLYVPVYLFEYSVFGQLFNVYISGCASSAEAAGIDHGLLTESVYKHFAAVVTGLERFFGLGRAFKSKNKKQQEGVMHMVLLAGWAAIRASRAVAVLLSPKAWGALAALSVVYHKVCKLFTTHRAPFHA
jgi:hypothetical protein